MFRKIRKKRKTHSWYHLPNRANLIILKLKIPPSVSRRWHLKPIRDNSEHFAVVIRKRHLLVPESILGKSCGSHLVSWGAWKQSQHKKENEVEPRVVDRSNLFDDLFEIPESRIQGQFRVKVNSKLEWKESPFLANLAWVGISVPGNQKVPKWYKWWTRQTQSLCLWNSQSNGSCCCCC